VTGGSDIAAFSYCFFFFFNELLFSSGDDLFFDLYDPVFPDSESFELLYNSLSFSFEAKLLLSG